MGTLQIRIGCTPVLVLSGLDTIRQALVRQGGFQGPARPLQLHFVSDGQSMTFNPDSGPVWAARRRLAQNALKVSPPLRLHPCPPATWKSM